LIEFYSSKEVPYGPFSNFLRRHPITMDGVVWPSSEHYYQAMKFLEPEHRERVRAAAIPMVAALIGRDTTLPLRSDWERVKDFVMYQAVLAKFTQYPELADLLLSTGEEEIIEHTVNDKYWADNGDYTGKNMLGQILMMVRTSLRAAKVNLQNEIAAASLRMAVKMNIPANQPEYRMGDVCPFTDDCKGELTMGEMKDAKEAEGFSIIHCPECYGYTMWGIKFKNLQHLRS